LRFTRLGPLVLCVAGVASVSPPWHAVSLAASRSQNPGVQQPIPPAVPLVISGTVLRADRTTAAANVRLQLRTLDKGTVVGATTSDANGAFSFPVPEPGRYLVEAINGRGVLAVSAPVTMTNTPLVANVILPEDRGPAAFLTSAVVLVVAAAAGAGILGLAAAAGGGPTSPEQ